MVRGTLPTIFFSVRKIWVCFFMLYICHFCMINFTCKFIDFTGSKLIWNGTFCCCNQKHFKQQVCHNCWIFENIKTLICTLKSFSMGGNSMNPTLAWSKVWNLLITTYTEGVMASHTRLVSKELVYHVIEHGKSIKHFCGWLLYLWNISNISIFFNIF